jgi:hypothetical protein
MWERNARGVRGYAVLYGMYVASMQMCRDANADATHCDSVLVPLEPRNPPHLPRPIRTRPVRSPHAHNPIPSASDDIPPVLARRDAQNLARVPDRASACPARSLALALPLAPLAPRRILAPHPRRHPPKWLPIRTQRVERIAKHDAALGRDVQVARGEGACGGRVRREREVARVARGEGEGGGEEGVDLAFCFGLRGVREEM